MRNIRRKKNLSLGWQQDFAAMASQHDLYTPSVYITPDDIIRFGQDLRAKRNIYIPLEWRGYPIHVYDYDPNGQVAIGWGARAVGQCSIAIGTSAKMNPIQLFSGK